MKKLITLAVFLFPFLGFTQNKTCTNYTLSIDLNTQDKVYHKVNTPYNSTAPSAASTIHPSNQISLVKKSSDVNPYVPGIYTECFEAIDKDGLKVECCRTVIVENNMTSAVSDIQPFEISVFPNPAVNEQITIQLGNPISSENIELTLCDMLGRQVFHLSQPFQNNISLSTEGYQLHSGVYTLTVKQGNVSSNTIIFFR
jgi:hypothetical protein